MGGQLSLGELGIDDIFVISFRGWLPSWRAFRILIHLRAQAFAAAPSALRWPP